MSFQNNSAFPVEGELVNITNSAGKGVSVKIIGESGVIDESKDSKVSGAKIGIADQERHSAPVGQEIYYNPPEYGKKINLLPGNGGVLPFGYFMEYSPLYIGNENETFGYNIQYNFGISQFDIQLERISAVSKEVNL